MALSVVTFNIDGGGGTRDEKKKMIDKFVREQSPSLIYVQENPWRGSNIKEHVEAIGESYEAVAHKHLHAVVLYRKDVLNDEGSVKLEKFFQNAFDKEEDKRQEEVERQEKDKIQEQDNKHLTYATFEKRASFSKLREIKTGTAFIAVSWHGEHSRLTDEQKVAKFEDILSVISEVHRETKLPVIFGGDFNIALKRVSNHMQRKSFKVYNYTLTKNRENKIDFFVVTSDVELSDVRALDQYMYIHVNDPQSGKLTKKAVFDHDPVQAMVTFVSDKDDDAKSDIASGGHDELDNDNLVQGMKSLTMFK